MPVQLQANRAPYSHVLYHAIIAPTSDQFTCKHPPREYDFAYDFAYDFWGLPGESLHIPPKKRKIGLDSNSCVWHNHEAPFDRCPAAERYTPPLG
ncbi:MAG: hypothetical protein OJF49_003084 [Ktedonobacterales bacterium]|nr:MAG: hypothetical protein OJF49_003084 [Ktedonobacterales bacterium]